MSMLSEHPYTHAAAFASDLGWAPGMFASKLIWEDGEVYDFFTYEYDAEGDLVSALYRAPKVLREIRVYHD